MKSCQLQVVQPRKVKQHTQKKKKPDVREK